MMGLEDKTGGPDASEKVNIHKIFFGKPLRCSKSCAYLCATNPAG